MDTQKDVSFFSSLFGSNSEKSLLDGSQGQV